MAVDPKLFGGCEGPESPFVRLVSSDNHSFYVKREQALMSGTIKAMLSGPGQFAEGVKNVIYLRDISSRILHKVCQYFGYKQRYTDSGSEIPEFDFEADVSLELMMAANFLQL